MVRRTARDRFDVVILGAGAAGLAAARELSSCGQRVCVVEARDRAGGRIYTVHEHDWPLPIDLGAEFIHGRPRETWDIIHAARLAAYDIPDDHWHLRGGRLYRARDFWGRIEQVMDKLDRVGTKDVSFDEFLAKHYRPRSDDHRDAARLARAYVEGFNAADAARISSIALRESEKSEQDIQATKLSRLADGYDGIVRWLCDGLSARGAELRLNAIATDVRWSRRAGVEVRLRSRGGQAVESIRARRAVIALPLGVLKASPGAGGAGEVGAGEIGAGEGGAGEVAAGEGDAGEGEVGTIRFSPQLPRAVRMAIARLEMGPVIKVLCRFRRAFWEDRKVPATGGRTSLADVVFLHGGQNLPLPTWWTMLSMRVPVLTGWVGGPAAAKLSSLDARGIEAAAIRSLASLLRIDPREIAGELESCRAHDWQRDPFSRGAYSYVGVGGRDAMKTLARPIADTLFFAGEHTHWEGMSGTVSGAISSGVRAAGQIGRA